MKSNNFFQTIWALDDFLVLDTETTGLHSRDEIVQLGIVNKAGEVLFDSLIKPTVPISPGAAAVHGISASMVESAPAVLDVHAQLHALLSDKDIVVYNAPFDRPKLARTCLAREAGDLSLLGRWHDGMQPYAEYWGAWSSYHQSFTWQSLINACYQQGIEVREDAHTAVADCLMTLALIEKLGMAETAVSDPWICDICAQEFENEVDLLAHQSNSPCEKELRERETAVSEETP